MNYEIKATPDGILIDLKTTEKLLESLRFENLRPNEESGELYKALSAAHDSLLILMMDKDEKKPELPPEGEYSPEFDDEPRPIHITTSSGDNINFVGVKIAHVGYRRPGSDQWTELVMYETPDGDRIAVKYAYALNRDTFVQAAWAYAGKSMATIYQMLRSGRLQHRLYQQAGIGNEIDL